MSVEIDKEYQEQDTLPSSGTQCGILENPLNGKNSNGKCDSKSAQTMTGDVNVGLERLNHTLLQTAANRVIGKSSR